MRNDAPPPITEKTDMLEKKLVLLQDEYELSL